jgi:hypothetical protein
MSSRDGLQKTDLAAESWTPKQKFLQNRGGRLPQRHTTTARVEHRGFEGKGVRVAPDLWRQLGIRERTDYRWKAKANYGGMESGGVKKLKQLEDEKLLT